jgi:hypothetical protein
VASSYVTVGGPKATNHRARLIRFRLIARQITRDPSLIAKLRAALDEIRPSDIWWVVEWRALLSLPPEQIRREITRRTDKAYELRMSSPLWLVEGIGIDFADIPTRRRIWRKAKLGVQSSSRS